MKDMEDNAREMLKNVDWNLLYAQKMTLLDIAEEQQNVSRKEMVEGLICLINHIQDFASDKLGIEGVFPVEEEEES